MAITAHSHAPGLQGEASQVLPSTDNCRWSGVPVMPYKEDGTLFKSISRQTLFCGDANLPVEFRYFEIDEDGHSTLERHHHVHVVMIIRGAGEVYVGGELRTIGLHDVVHIPPMTWHQFRATQGDKLGFLCVVNMDRDRPQRPTADELAELQSDPAAKAFLRS